WPANPGARAVIASGIKNPISNAAAIRIALIVPSTRPAKAAALGAPATSRRRSQLGTSAAFSAPSDNSRLTTLTNWKATRKASATAPVPSRAAIMESRRNPRSREASVPEDTVRKERIMGLPWQEPLHNDTNFGFGTLAQQEERDG